MKKNTNIRKPNKANGQRATGSKAILILFIIGSVMVVLTSPSLNSSRSEAAPLNTSAIPQPTPPDKTLNGQELTDFVQLLRDETENGLDDVFDLATTNRIKDAISEAFDAEGLEGLEAQEVAEEYLAAVDEAFLDINDEEKVGRALNSITNNILILLDQQPEGTGPAQQLEPLPAPIDVPTPGPTPRPVATPRPTTTVNTACNAGYARGNDGSCVLEVKFFNGASKSLQQNQQIAANNGWVMATTAQVQQAWQKAGLHAFAFGMTSNGSMCVPIQSNVSSFTRGANCNDNRGNQGFLYVSKQAIQTGPGGGTVAVNPTPRPTPRPVATPRPTPRPAPAPVNNAAALKQYIGGLNYDPRILLGETSGRGSATPLPNTTKGIRGGAMVCSRKTIKSSQNFEEITVFKPTEGVIYPGAAIYGDGTLRDGLPRPITQLKRRPAALRVNLPGIGSRGNFTVDDPRSFSSVQGKIEDILEYWNTVPASQGYVNANDSTYTVTTAYNRQQIGAGLNVDVKWASGNAQVDFAFKSDTEKNDVVAMYRQVFYTVTYDAPNSPEELFDPSVSRAQAESVFNGNQPPAYVSSVKYGRILLFRLETSSNITNVDAKAAFEYGAKKAETGVTVKANASYDQILRDSKMTVVALGGNAAAASEVIYDANSPKDLVPILKGQNAVYSRSNPGVPIAYKVKYLRDNRIAKLGLTTDYTEENCKTFYNFVVRVKHRAAYIGDVTLAYRAPGRGNLNKAIDAKLIPGVKANEIRTIAPFRRGNTRDIFFFQRRGMTAGLDQTWTIPALAKDIRLVITGRTGLVWAPHGEVVNMPLTPALFKNATNPTGPNTPLCITFTGTTLSRKWNKNC